MSYGPRNFDLFVDDDLVLKVGTKMSREKDMYDLDMPYDPLRKFVHESRDFAAVDRQRRAEIAVVASFSSALPLPPPPPVEIPLDNEEHDTDAQCIPGMSLFP